MCVLPCEPPILFKNIKHTKQHRLGGKSVQDQCSGRLQEQGKLNIKVREFSPEDQIVMGLDLLSSCAAKFTSHALEIRGTRCMQISCLLDIFDRLNLQLSSQQ